ARVGLAGAGSGLRAPDAIAAALRKERLPDATAHAATIEGVLARRAGRDVEARMAFEEAGRGFDEAGVLLERAVIDLRMAELDGVDRAPVLERIRALGVSDPERWSDVVAPVRR
ncbi:MAG: hypothetical protein KC621_11665, partial [Myxococcales bacterium]|nr:hypothetical protein [Myxococcales bacterium]